MVQLALFQPDIPANFGAALRLCACFHACLHVIEPCGFPLDDKRIRRTGLDYISHVELIRHMSWEKFQESVAGRRVLLLSTKAATPYYDYSFEKEDIVLMGRESAGVPEQVHASAHARLTIPMAHGVRSLNVTHAAAIVMAEAYRQAMKCRDAVPLLSTAYP